MFLRYKDNLVTILKVILINYLKVILMRNSSTLIYEHYRIFVLMVRL